MKKTTVLMLMLGMSSASLWAEGASQTTSTVSETQTVEVLQKKIEALKKQIEAVALLVKDQGNQVKEIKSEHAQSKEHSSSVVENITQPKEKAPIFDKGYIAIPGTTAGMKVSGMVKLDMIRDTKAHTGEQTNVSRMPYALQMRNASLPNAPATSSTAKWKDHFYLHAKQSKLRFDFLAKNKSGNDVTAVVEGDFFGSTQFGDNFPNGPASATQVSTTYTFRLRHALLGYKGLEAGHTTTTFHTTEAYIPEIDLNGLVGGDARHALIRYTHKFGNFAVTAAAEHGRADYVTYKNNPTGTQAHYTYNAQDSSNNLSKPTRPDLILKFKYDFDNGGLFAVSVVNRDLQIKNNAVSGNNDISTVDGKTYKGTGWGTNIALKLMTFGKSYLICGVATGRGIGWYILEANGRSSLFDPTLADGQRIYKQIKTSMYLVGYSHSWNPQWQTNFGVARFELGTQSLSNSRSVIRWYEPGIDKTFNKYLINTIYKPEENIELGLEYFVLQRKSTLKYRGLGQRLQFGASYKF